MVFQPIAKQGIHIFQKYIAGDYRKHVPFGASIMCIIAVTQQGAPELTQNELAALMEKNPDGVGVAWIEGNQMRLWRALHASVTELLGVFRQIPQLSPSVLHLRQATRGAVTLAQVQPLMVDEQQGLVLAHNGTLPGFGDSVLSDSQQFVRDVVLPACARAGSCWQNAETLPRLEAGIPQGNRIVLLDRTGNCEVVHPEEGFSYRNMWLSNRKMAVFLEDYAELQANV